MQCNLVMDGKPSKLYQHITQDCKSVSASDKQAYEELELIRTGKDVPNTTNKSHDMSAENPESTMIKRPKFQHDFSLFFKHQKPDKVQETEHLLKTLITGHVPFRFLQNRSFQAFRQSITITPYTPASRFMMMGTVLPRVHAAYSVKTKAKLKQQINLTTILLDGWSDCSQNSVYAVLLLCGTSFKKLIDVLDLDDVWHTPENILVALKDVLKGQAVTWVQIGAIVTDSPSSMI